MCTHKHRGTHTSTIMRLLASTQTLLTSAHCRLRAHPHATCTEVHTLTLTDGHAVTCLHTDILADWQTGLPCQRKRRRNQRRCHRQRESQRRRDSDAHRHRFGRLSRPVQGDFDLCTSRRVVQSCREQPTHHVRP